ncbi:hypothetical protein AGLY_007807, partial [Aphis glycines]
SIDVVIYVSGCPVSKNCNKNIDSPLDSSGASGSLSSSGLGPKAATGSTNCSSSTPFLVKRVMMIPPMETSFKAGLFSISKLGSGFCSSFFSSFFLLVDASFSSISIFSLVDGSTAFTLPLPLPPSRRLALAAILNTAVVTFSLSSRFFSSIAAGYAYSEGLALLFSSRRGILRCAFNAIIHVGVKASAKQWASGNQYQY